MEQSTDKKIELKHRIILFYNKNKLAIYSSICIFILAIIISLYKSSNIKKKNNLIAEKYIDIKIMRKINKRELIFNL